MSDVADLVGEIAVLQAELTTVRQAVVLEIVAALRSASWTDGESRFPVAADYIEREFATPASTRDDS